MDAAAASLKLERARRRVEQTVKKLQNAQSNVQRAKDERTKLMQALESSTHLTDDDNNNNNNDNNNNVTAEEVRMAAEGVEIKATNRDALRLQVNSAQLRYAAASFGKKAVELQQRGQPREKIRSMSD